MFNKFDDNTIYNPSNKLSNNTQPATNSVQVDQMLKILHDSPKLVTEIYRQLSCLNPELNLCSTEKDDNSKDLINRSCTTYEVEPDAIVVSEFDLSSFKNSNDSKGCNNFVHPTAIKVNLTDMDGYPINLSKYSDHWSDEGNWSLNLADLLRNNYYAVNRLMYQIAHEINHIKRINFEISYHSLKVMSLMDARQLEYSQVGCTESYFASVNDKSVYDTKIAMLTVICTINALQELVDVQNTCININCDYQFNVQ